MQVEMFYTNYFGGSQVNQKHSFKPTHYDIILQTWDKHGLWHLEAP